jgi:uncharacterized protein
VRRFEWDERKNKENIRKHGFDFQDAHEIFDSPLLVRLDTRKEYGEDRWKATGMLRGRFVVLAFTERNEGTVVRIISLRKALRQERKAYEDKISY